MSPPSRCTCRRGLVASSGDWLEWFKHGMSWHWRKPRYGTCVFCFYMAHIVAKGGLFWCLPFIPTFIAIPELARNSYKSSQDWIADSPPLMSIIGPLLAKPGTNGRDPILWPCLERLVATLMLSYSFSQFLFVVQEVVFFERINFMILANLAISSMAICIWKNLGAQVDLASVPKQSW